MPRIDVEGETLDGRDGLTVEDATDGPLNTELIQLFEGATLTLSHPADER